jgi:ABC-type Mn2+/Zn2+ transport system permease subunit
MRPLDGLVDWISDPYSSEFMQRALVAAVLVGVVAPVVGVWIVLRRLAYLGDAMSHSLLAGVAGAYLWGWSVTGGALVAGVAMAGLVGLLAAHPRLREDAVIGVVGTALFALGVVLVSTRTTAIGVDLSSFLLGQITTVTDADLVTNGTLAVLVLGLVGWFFTDLRHATFDPVHAAVTGVPVATLGFGLLVVLAVAIVVSLQTVGLLMSVAMLVNPAATARLVATRVSTMTLAAVGFGVSSAVVGLTASYHLSSPPGATVALAAVTVLAVVFAATYPRRRHTHHAHVGAQP